jgi:hypothetical protein
MTLSVPAFGRLSIGRLTELKRTGYIVAAHFNHSTFSPSVRPFFSDCPGDTAASYRAGYRGHAGSQKTVLDTLDQDDEKENVSVPTC